MRPFLAVLISICLAACGGGGGGGGGTSTPTPTNAAPTVTSANTASVVEGGTALLDIATNDSDGDTVTLTLAGIDASLFTLIGNALSFTTAPDFEAPGSAASSNTYSLRLSASDGTNTTAQDITVSVTDAIEGRVIDGPLSGAKVFIDLNGNLLQDADEPSVSTDADGNFKLPIVVAADGQTLKLVSIGGTDTSTASVLPNIALVSDVPATAGTPAAITPLSTIVAAATTPEAKKSILGSLGVSGSVDDFLKRDVWEEAKNGNVSAANIQKANLAISAVLQTATSLIDTSDGASAVANATNVTNALAKQIVTQAEAGEDVFDAAVLTTMLEQGVSEYADVSEPTLDLSPAVFAAVSQSVANLVVIIKGTVDPTSADAADIASTVQDSLQTAVAAVVETGDTAAFDTASSTATLFSNASAAVAAVVNLDTDGDGIINTLDPDIDNDSVANALDKFPLDRFETLDTDRDGIGNYTDTDDDGDGFPDAVDEFPLDATKNNVTSVFAGASAPTPAASTPAASTPAASASAAGNRAPVITRPGMLTVVEGTAAVATISASDPDNDSLTFAIQAGYDQAFFSITSSGVLVFSAAPDFESPANARADNVYQLVVEVSDGSLTHDELISITVTNVVEKFDYYGTLTPSWVATPPDDYQFFDPDTEMVGQMKGVEHEMTISPGGGKFNFHRVRHTVKHGLEWGQQFGVFGSWLTSQDRNNTIEGGHWVNPKVDGPEYYPTLHFGGALISYSACSDVGMGGGIYERVLGDRWLNMVQISNRVIYGAGVNIAFDMEQEPYKEDNGIWAGSGWAALDFDHPRDFNFWMSFVEAGNYQGPVVGYLPEYWNWLDPELYNPSDVDDSFASLADNGLNADIIMGNERIGMRAKSIGNDIFYVPVPKLPDYKAKEYIVAHPQEVTLSAMDDYSTELKEGRLTETLILSSDKTFNKFYESFSQQLKFKEEINGEDHYSVVVPPYTLGYDSKGAFVSWDHSSDVAKQRQTQKNGYMYVRKTQEKWCNPQCEGQVGDYGGRTLQDSFDAEVFPNVYRTEIIDAPDDIVRVPRVNHRFYNNKERDTTNPDFANWDTTGKKRYSVILQNGATVTYVWVKFIEQPAMKTARQNHPETYTTEYLNKLQSYIEALHLAINQNSSESPTDPVFINYRGGDNPDDKDPHLANISPTQLIRPEEGFEVGYVPLVISQYHPVAFGAARYGNVNASAQGLWTEPSQQCTNDQWVDSYWHKENR